MPWYDTTTSVNLQGLFFQNTQYFVYRRRGLGSGIRILRRILGRALSFLAISNGKADYGAGRLDEQAYGKEPNQSVEISRRIAFHAIDDP